MNDTNRLPWVFLIFGLFFFFSGIKTPSTQTSSAEWPSIPRPTTSGLVVGTSKCSAEKSADDTFAERHTEKFTVIALWSVQVDRSSPLNEMSND